MLKRELYLKRVRPYYDSELIKVITGVRRCGKSVLLQQIRNELMENGIDEDRIIYINFEDYQYRELKDPDRFYNYVEDRLSGEKKHYLIFDEIQNVDKFELVINSFRAVHDVSIFITGSNSKLLSGELSSHLSGRTISFRMMPFTFKEFCDLKEAENPESLLPEYISYGGFPIVCIAETPEMKEEILSNLYDSIVLKDIIMRNKVASPAALERVLEYLTANSSLTLSGQSIARTLSDQTQSVTAPTIYDYIRYIENSCIMNKVERYDIRGKKVLAFEEKSYICDLGFFHIKKNRIKDEFGRIVETLIYNELIARGYQVYIGKTFKGEVDFIAQKGHKKVYIQAAYHLEDEETIEREFGAYKSIHDNYPKYVISHDDWKLDDADGIIHLPLLEFLLDENSI